MTIEQYQKEVKRTMNKSLNFEQSIIMLCMGLAGESGELIDNLKKVFYHNHDLDIHYAINEIGDILWYIFNLSDKLGLDISYIMDLNIEKLKQRYPDGFDCEKSISRGED